MIISIEGRLEKATPLAAVITANGLGYQVHVPVTTAAKLPAIGTSVKLHTKAVYREDSQALYGFTTEEERDFFTLVVDKVSGVGPKVAISLMSKLDLESLANAIASEDSVLISKTPGIGKKTAERIVIELKDKIGHLAASPARAGAPPAADSTTSDDGIATNESDAIKALEALGYKRAQAEKSIKKAIERFGPDIDTESLIRSALR